MLVASVAPEPAVIVVVLMTGMKLRTIIPAVAIVNALEVIGLEPPLEPADCYRVRNQRPVEDWRALGQ